MNKELVKTEYSLRFVGIDLESINDFSESFPAISFETRPYFKGNNKYVLVFPLDKYFDIKEICEFFERLENYERLDLFMAINSETDNYIVEIPPYVLDAVRALPIKVNVSFVYFEEDAS